MLRLGQALGHLGWRHTIHTWKKATNLSVSRVALITIMRGPICRLASVQRGRQGGSQRRWYHSIIVTPLIAGLQRTEAAAHRASNNRAECML
jgi:hypothetical protein